jgi:hypothetical protein
MKTNALAALSEPGSAIQLAVIRIAVCLQVARVSRGEVFEVVSLAEGGSGHRSYVPRIFGTVVPEAYAPYLGDAVAVVACVAALGLFTRYALPLTTLGFFVLESYFWRKFDAPIPWIYLLFPMAVLCLSPCSDRLSLDRLLRRRGALPHPEGGYGWPAVMIQIWIGLLYFQAGLAKLFPLKHGIEWLEGGTLKNVMYTRFLDSPTYWLLGQPMFDYSAAYWPFVAMAISSVLLELAALSIILYRPLMYPVLVMILSFHVVLWFLGVFGFLNLYLTLLLAFIPPEWFPDLRRQGTVAA